MSVLLLPNDGFRVIPERSALQIAEQRKIASRGKECLMDSHFFETLARGAKNEFLDTKSIDLPNSVFFSHFTASQLQLMQSTTEAFVLAIVDGVYYTKCQSLSGDSVERKPTLSSHEFTNLDKFAATQVIREFVSNEDRARIASVFPLPKLKSETAAYAKFRQPRGKKGKINEKTLHINKKLLYISMKNLTLAAGVTRLSESAINIILYELVWPFVYATVKRAYITFAGRENRTFAEIRPSDEDVGYALKSLFGRPVYNLEVGTITAPEENPTPILKTTTKKKVQRGGGRKSQTVGEKVTNKILQQFSK